MLWAVLAVLEMNWVFSFYYQRLTRWPQICFLFLGTHLNYISHPPCICVGPWDCVLTNECRDRLMDHSKAKAAVSSYTASDSLFPSPGNFGDYDTHSSLLEWKRLGFLSQCWWSVAKGSTEPEPLNIRLCRNKKWGLPFSCGYLVLIITAATINCLNGSKHQVFTAPF